ncbi:hypothetical protein [Streptomyces sp. NPDC091416]|uniref:hypothetical protein n=1 Tax=Streptomyces sp. NPDC091416 TaxID=3366003 RepID=UPI0037F6A350
MHTVEEVFARQTAAALEGLPGFAELSHSGPIVEWGEQPPAHYRPYECHQFYGLVDPAGDMDSPSTLPARRRRYGTETGLCPPPAEQVSGRVLAPRESARTVAATLP